MIDARQHAKAMWESGDYTMRDICACVGREMPVVRAWKLEDGWRTDFEPRSHGEDVKAEALSLVDAGVPEAEIARRCRINRKTVQRWRAARPASRWRCGCSEYGGVLATKTCPRCNRAAPF